MKLTLAEPRYLKESMSIISELVTEARIKATKNGLELIAVDPANVAMVTFKLLASSFAEYEIEKDVEIGINLTQLKQILRRAGATDVLTLEVENNKLKVILKSKTKRVFNLQLIDIDEKEQTTPDLEYKTRIETTAETLSQAIDDVDIVSEAVLFTVTPAGVVTLEADSDQNSVAIELPVQETKVETEEEQQAKYSVEYFKKIIGGSKLADKVIIEFAKKYPIRVTYTERDKISLVFILAPRVE